MKVDKHLISHLEHLARLQLSEEEQAQLQNDLNRILDMVGKLDTLDTEGVAPLVYVNEEVDTLRPDQIAGQLPRDLALRNAPQQDGKHFMVPKVIKKKGK
ncbi:MAG TPA: Asp-tRNA(Asn)/Glu-tRNA(Gln) amidotransferase subunit GatC [Phaeodactylibacter sp.]|nr:Asp-tRNA(Asn)/Glu-tRNA(Gln) amidotransferase subunit GatC [Phaeodactylibacter sp.]